MQTMLKSLGIDRMSIDERMQLVEEIWDSIASEPKPIEIAERHKQLIDER
jgi:putative addiction module component (TIGR02574 family)